MSWSTNKQQKNKTEKNENLATIQRYFFGAILNIKFYYLEYHSSCLLLMFYENNAIVFGLWIVSERARTPKFEKITFNIFLTFQNVLLN